jgi:hypothetical protein
MAGFIVPDTASTEALVVSLLKMKPSTVDR